jgi:hypothetical protein
VQSLAINYQIPIRSHFSLVCTIVVTALINTNGMGNPARSVAHSSHLLMEDQLVMESATVKTVSIGRKMVV